ncbi:MAG: glycosyltransferase family 2 protein [Bacteroidales bacterium]|nr:glycosyltransferase family 2 protein [Bacteroidales bacterium]
MRTAVVILNYNTRNYLEQFLPGLIASCQGQDAEVFVADNASADDSVAFLQAHFPQVPLILLEKNYGFTGGYNRALEMIEADYYVLINSDIEVPEGWLKPLTEWMDSHPDCGACGPKLLSWHQRDTFEYAGAAGGLIDRYGYPFCRGRILQKVEKDEGQYDSPQNVLWVSGACLMVRSGVWKELGGLDQRFFAHMEEIDLCWRMQLRGWKVTVVPASAVYHIGGGTLRNESPFKLFLNFRNNLLLLENNLPSTLHSRRKTRLRIRARMCLDGLSALVYLCKGQGSFFMAVVRAHRDYRKLRRPGPLLPDAPAPDGLYPGWIVPVGLFGKK